MVEHMVREIKPEMPTCKGMCLSPSTHWPHDKIWGEAGNTTGYAQLLLLVALRRSYAVSVIEQGLTPNTIALASELLCSGA